MMKQILFFLLLIAKIGNAQNAGSGVTDIEGNTYSTVIIGQQEWMSENLKTTKFSNGDEIGTTPFNAYNYYGENEPKYQWSLIGYSNYGRHYTWYAAMDSRNICPIDWKVPSANDWETLIGYLGGYNSGGKLKEAGNSHWDSPNSDATNSSGFNALPSGYHHFYGTLNGVGYNSFFLSSTVYSPDDGWFIYLNAGNSNINFNGMSPTKKLGMSCRCIKKSSLGVNSNEWGVLNVFPNPCNQNIVSITSSLSQFGLYEVMVYDMLGKEVIKTKMDNNILDVTGLTSGIYLVKVSVDEKMLTAKLIINRK